MIIYNHTVFIVFQLSLVLSCIVTPAGVIAGVVVGVFLALVLIIVVAVIVATVVLVHRRKTVPGMCLKFEYVHVAMLWLVALCTHSLLAVQELRLQRPRHPVQGEHCSVQCSSSAMAVSVWCMVNVVSTCAFPTAVMKVPLTVVKTPNRSVCMVCYCRVRLVFAKP